MALKGSFDHPDDAPEFLRDHVVEKEGKWVLDVEGYVSKETLDSFRTNNRQLKNEGDKLKKDLELLHKQFTDTETRYAGVDPEEYRAMKAAPTDVQKQIAEAEARLKASYEKTYGEQFAREQARTKEAEAKFHHALIANEVALAAPGVGVQETALEDLQTRASRVFRVTEGKVVPFRGEDPLYSEKEPSQFLSMKEWLGGLQKEYPHYFKPSAGGGAGGGLGGRSQNGRPVIPASDQRAFIARLEDIASGKVEVDLNA
jgi:hypothetical protein